MLYFRSVTALVSVIINIHHKHFRLEIFEITKTEKVHCNIYASQSDLKVNEVKSEVDANHAFSYSSIHNRPIHDIDNCCTHF